MLKCVHLQGREVTVTIESVTPGEIVGVGGKADRMPIVKFKGEKLPFGLNRTNENTLATLFGPTPRGMIGKRITLYPTTTKGKSGDVVDCIRIRPHLPKEQTTNGPATAPSGVDRDNS